MDAAAASPAAAVATGFALAAPQRRAPEAAWLAAVPSAELERLVRLPAARLAAVFADALAARRRQLLGEDPAAAVLVVADARARQRVDAVDGSWPWAACGLVLRVLHEDDRLCAALTCRAFRDALFALTEGAKKRADKQKRGARFRTAPRALACSVGRLRWARGLQSAESGARPPWLARWDGGTCAVLARHGGLAALQWARASGCDWDSATCAAAAAGGHLAVLQWARANGCDWRSDTCAAAAKGGHLAVLQWARANGCAWDCDVCAYAAGAGHLYVLQWARVNGCEWNFWTCAYAAGGGPPSPKTASHSLRRALLTPEVNTGSLYRCGKRT